MILISFIGLYAVAFFIGGFSDTKLIPRALGLRNDFSIVSGLSSYFVGSEFTLKVMMESKIVEVDFWPEYLCDDDARYHNLKERLNIIQQTWCRRMKQVQTQLYNDAGMKVHSVWNMRVMELRRFSEMMHNAHGLYALSHLAKSEDAKTAWEKIKSNVFTFLQNSLCENLVLVTHPKNVVQGVERLIELKDLGTFLLIYRMTFSSSVFPSNHTKYPN